MSGLSVALSLLGELVSSHSPVSCDSLVITLTWCPRYLYSAPSLCLCWVIVWFWVMVFLLFMFDPCSCTPGPGLFLPSCLGKRQQLFFFFFFAYWWCAALNYMIRLVTQQQHTWLMPCNITTAFMAYKMGSNQRLFGGFTPLHMVRPKLINTHSFKTIYKSVRKSRDVCTKERRDTELQ